MKPFALAVAFAAFASFAAVSAAAQERTGALKRIADTGAITIGYRTDSPPFSEGNPNDGQPRGYTIDLCLGVAAAIKTELGNPSIAIRFVPVDATNRFEKVATGAVDMECGNSTVTLSRMRQVDFSNLTFITGGALLVGTKSTVRSAADLSGKKVAVVAGTTTEKALREVIAGNGIAATVVALKNYDEGVALLEKGEVEVLAGDQIVLIGLARQAKDKAAFALAPELFSYEPLAITVPRNDADFRLVVNRTLAGLYRSGAVGSIYTKWFGDWGGRPAPLLVALYQLNSLPD